MSEAYRIARAYEREMEALSKDFERGRISKAEFDQGMHDLHREMQDEMEAARYEAMEAAAAEFDYY